ncbi:MAG: glycosyltransferase family 9 protein [Elusimicrobia bacterium]|nr:glycosyltransferase family 9 protein [Elusimicrobiota bacterium]
MGKVSTGIAHLLDYAGLAARLSGAARPSAALPQKTLIIGYGAVGDVIFMLPMLKALRQGLPGTRLSFVSDRNPATTELLPAASLVDEIFYHDLHELPTARFRAELAARVRSADFNAVIISQATPLRHFASAILPIPVRVAHLRPIDAATPGWSAPRSALWKLRRGVISSEFERRLAVNRPVWVQEEAEHAVARNLRLAAALGVAVPSAAASRPELPLTDAAKAWAAARLPKAGVKTVGIHLGSPQSQYNKIWAPGRWGAVAKELARDYRCRIAVFGGPAEAACVGAFACEFRGEFVDLVAKAKLLETFAAIKRCDLFLSSDTGLSKAAMALQVPTLSVWGPISRRDTGAVWDRELHAEVSLELSCSPCVSMALRKEGPGIINFATCGHHNCLEELSPNVVFAAVVKHHGARLRG